MAGERIKILGTEEMKNRMNDPGPFILIDARDEEDYKKMHIPGAISMPVYEVERRCETLDKNDEIIIYCSGFMCDASADAANIFWKKGFRNLSDYKGGIQDWIAGNNATE